ncbi:MAG: YjbQ family protein [Thermoplasmata archaeon]|nr:YjbQ family protein [Thermoplasmata archaeon]
MISEIEVKTSGELDIINITPLVEEVVRRSGVAKGMVFLFLKSTTSALIINEDEEGLKNDLREIMETLIPRGRRYAHNRAWGEENAHSHLRSILLGNSLQIPLEGGRLMLGTWQSVFLVELDVRPRTRKIVVSIVPLE